MSNTSPSASLNPDRLAGYVEAWRRRAEKREEEEQRQAQQAMAAAKRAAKLLAERYGVTRVLLFGSLVSHRRFRTDSDIDLAVEGLAPDRFFRADAELALEIDMPIDLKMVSDFSPAVRQRIEREGLVLHDG